MHASLLVCLGIVHLPTAPENEPSAARFRR
jgi:hypothetical protein